MKNKIRLNTKVGPTKEYKITKRAQEIFKKMNARCDLGGCDNHSGHEICSRDAAFDHAVKQAEEEIGE